MTVKQLNPDVHERRIRPVKMWRDDIQQISALLNENTDRGNGNHNGSSWTDTESLIQIRVQCGTVEFELESIDDFVELQASKVDMINIAETSRKISLTLGSENKITVPDPSIQTRMIVDQIERLATERPRYGRMRWVFTWPAQLALSVALVAAGVTLGNHIGVKIDGKEIALFPVLLFLISYPLIGLGVLNLPWFQKSVIYTASHAEQPTFVERKRDDITIAILSLIAGGALGYWINAIS